MIGGAKVGGPINSSPLSKKPAQPAPKKSPKTANKTNKKTKKSSGFKIYIRKVQVQVAPDYQMGSNALMQLNGYIESLAQCISKQAAMNAKFAGRQTINVDEVKAASLLVLPTTLGSKAVSEGSKAVIKYKASNTPQDVPKGRTSSTAFQAGLQVSPALAKKWLRGFGMSKLRVGQLSATFFAGVLEQVLYTVLEATFNITRDAKKRSINSRYLALAIANDAELSELLERVDGYILGGGVPVSFNEKLAPTKDMLKKRTNARNRQHNRAVRNGLKDKERQKGKTSSYVTATRSIKKEQKSGKIILPKATFKRGVAKLLSMYPSTTAVAKRDFDVKLGNRAVFYLQQYAEAAAVNFYSKVVDVMSHADRYTIKAEDVEVTKNIVGMRSNSDFVDFFGGEGEKGGIPSTRIRRLCRRAGAIRISKEAYDPLRQVLENIVNNVVYPTYLLLNLRKTRTISPEILKNGAKASDVNLFIDNSTKVSKATAKSAKSPKAKSPTAGSPTKASPKKANKKATKKTKRSP